MTQTNQQPDQPDVTTPPTKRRLADWEISSVTDNNNESTTTVIFPSSENTESIELVNEESKQ